MESQAAPVALEALVVTASLLVKAGQEEQAIELLALVSCHPASGKDTQEEAKRLLVDLEAQLPTEVAAAAWKRGQTQELEEVMRCHTLDGRYWPSWSNLLPSGEW